MKIFKDMLFRIRFDILPPERGNPRHINASLHYENADFLKSQLGTFMYYHFLRNFFEDISSFHREGDIAFCKPGIGDLCITWDVSIDEKPESIKSKIKEGLQYASITEKQKYWEKYSMTTALNIRDNAEMNLDESSFLITIEANFYSLHTTDTTKAELIAEA